MISIVTFGAVCFGGYKLITRKDDRGNKNYDEFVFPEHLKYSSDQLLIDCNLDVPEDFSNKKLKSTEAHTIIFSDHSGKLHSLFSDNLRNTDYSEKKIYDDEGIYGAQKLWNTGKPDVESVCLNLFVSSMYFLNADSCNISLGAECLRVNEEEGCYQGYPSGFGYNADIFPKELSFASLDDVVKKVTAQLDCADVHLTLDYEGFGVSKEMVLSQYCAVKSDGSYDCTLSDDDYESFEEYYQIYARQKLQNLPVIYYKGGINRESAPIRISYSKTGIKYLEINRAFSFVESKEDIGAFATEDDILEAIKNRYENILSDCIYTVNKGGLYYYAYGNGNKMDFDMIPVWAFMVKEESRNNKNEVYSSMFLIDAVTGKEIPYEP